MEIKGTAPLWFKFLAKDRMNLLSFLEMAIILMPIKSLSKGIAELGTLVPRTLK